MRPVSGVPAEISTSYVERSNLSVRMASRRFTRLTNGFSKKLDNHGAAVSLYVAHYNLCRVHESLTPSARHQRTPAMAIGIADHVWSIAIEIPEIVVLPTREVTFGYHDFDLQGLKSIARQPVSDQIWMVQRLRDDARSYLARAVEGAREDRPENYLVRHLMDMSEIDYDSQNELLFKLSGQMVARIRSYLSDEDDIENVLLVHGKDLARFIFEQMKQHYWETPTDYRATRFPGGFQLLRPQAFNVPNDRAVRPFRQPVVPAGDTRKARLWRVAQKCCYPYQRFQSNEEREFAVLIDSNNEVDVMRWMKPEPVSSVSNMPTASHTSRISRSKPEAKS